MKKAQKALAGRVARCRSTSPRYGVRCEKPSGHADTHHWNNGLPQPYYAFAFWHLGTAAYYGLDIEPARAASAPVSRRGGTK